MQSTYRLQFHRAFTFNDARKIAGYLSDLGITHAYASPYLKARPGSTHGYDVVDPRVLNPEIGTEADYESWLAELASHGMSHILDTVPNHMGVGCNDNPWWNDVLQDGEQSIYADYFDIDWERGRDRKLLLPILGKPYGHALHDGELKLAFDAETGQFLVRYFERQLPIAPASIVQILSSSGAPLSTLVAELTRLPGRGADRVAVKTAWEKRLALLTSSTAIVGKIEESIVPFNGTPGRVASFGSLHGLLEKQSYRLASWQAAPEQINYRRFFDINDLAALKMERETVFHDVHELTLRLVDAGKIAGLRVDHPDGLRDPAAYFHRLQEGRSQGRLYTSVEKILAPGEGLPTSWEVSGTSGYDFLNQVNGLYVDPSGEAPLTRLFARWSELPDSFAAIAIQKKRFILQQSFPGDLLALARRLEVLVRADRLARDLSFSAVHTALGELVANFPVYRTYIAGDDVSAIDIRHVGDAIEQTLRYIPTVDRDALQLVGDVLLRRWPVAPDSQTRDRADDFIARFQQLTAPVTAKGVEDTAFYVYNRLISLNEVGNDPGRFGVSPAELHAYLSDRQANWAAAMSCLSTHDTKRSEDVRARINVLSEIAGQWEANVDAWGRLNMPLHQVIDSQRAPSGNDEYLFYQTLLGVWPDDAIDEDLIERILQYMTKAMREAKGTTNWTCPNAPYERAVLDFVSGALRGVAGDGFLKSFGLFATQVSKTGALNSISQTILRLLAPGVPDTYQGTELIDLSLVDPDNRRSVDYSRRDSMLHEVRQLALGGSSDEIATALGAGLASGQTKLHITWRLLHLRRDNPELFTSGEYLPLPGVGQQADRVFAFARRYKEQTLVVIVPRLIARLARDDRDLPTGDQAWGDTCINCRQLLDAENFVDQLTGLPACADAQRIDIARVFARFPAAVLMTR